MKRVTATSILNFGLSDDQRTSVLMLDGERLPAGEVVAIEAGQLVQWIVGVLAMSADVLVEARDAQRAEARSKAH